MLNAKLPSKQATITYFVTFKNDFIYYFKIYYIHYKSEIFVMFLRFKFYLKSRDY